MYASNRESLINANGGIGSHKIEDGRSLGKTVEVNGEIADIFPALQKYKDEHNAANLQKLMVEILGFCRSVYASTRSEDERKIYHSMIEKLNK